MFKINPKPFLVCLALTASLDTTLDLNHHTLYAQEVEDRIQTVIYSYEKWTKDGDKRYVLVPKPVSIKKGELKDQFRELYQLLKEGKSNTYGDVKFQAKDDVVYIFLDKSKSNLHPIVVAEATYTFTENGAKSVEFPDSSIIKPQTRKDIRYPAYQLSFPFYSVLPPKQVTGVLVELPDGSFLTPNAFYDLLKNKDPKIIAQLISGLKEGDPLVIESILKAQETLQFQLSEGLLPLLNNGSEDVRILAIKGLKGDDRAEINSALREVMDKDPSMKVKDEAAAVLSLSKDVKFSEAASFHALRSQDPNVVKQAAKGLIQAKSKEAVPQLFNTLSHADAGVRDAVIEALIAKKEMKGLADQLSGSLDVQAKKQVAIALMKLQQETVSLPALTFLMENAEASSIKEVSTQLLSYAKNPKIVDVLGLGLKNKEVEVKKATAKAMSQLDAKSAKAAITMLAEQSWDDLETGRIMAESMQALHVKLGFAEVSKDLSASKETIKLSAISALGKLFIDAKEKKNQPKITAELDKILKGTDIKSKAQAARSYGEMANEIGSKALVELSKATEVEIRKMVAFGFKFYAEGLSTEFLSKQLEEQDPSLLIYTIQSIAHLKSMKAADMLLNEKFSTHENIKVRRAVMKAFVQLAGSFNQKQQGLLISLLGARLEGDQDLTVRVQSALALGNVKLDTAIDILTPNAQSENQKLKFAILQAFVNHNTVASIKSLELILEDKDDQVREKALGFLGKISNAQAKAELKQILNKRLSKETISKIKSDIEALLKSL